MSAVMHAYTNVTLSEKVAPRERPARVPPAFKVAAVASVAGLRDSRGDAPLDAFVPVRAEIDPPRVIAAQTVTVLSLVDGRRALRDIAREAGLALATTIEAHFDLVGLGLVSVA